MKNAPMRFGGLSLSHNPHTLIIEHSGNIRELMPPCCEPDSVYLGERISRVSGEGEIYGEDCIERFAVLEKLYKVHIRSKLALPHMRPIYAYIKELELIAEPMDNVLRYRFVFTEAQSPRKSERLGVYHTVIGSESLWDISYSYGVPIERLIELNTGIPYIDDVSEGTRVRIC